MDKYKTDYCVKRDYFDKFSKLDHVVDYELGYMEPAYVNGTPMFLYGGSVRSLELFRAETYSVKAYSVQMDEGSLSGKDECLISTQLAKEENYKIGDTIVITDENGKQLLTLTSSLNAVGLSERMHHKPLDMSGGEQQRVAIARVIAMNPHIILADEPTGNLDQKSTKEVMDLLAERVRDGGTVVMVTHNTGLIVYASRVLHIEDGNIIEK